MKNHDSLIATKRIRLCVPIRRQSCIDRFSLWLTRNRNYTNSEVLFLHILRPNWFDETPYCSSQAARLLDLQDMITAETEREFRAVAKRLENLYPDLSVSVKVIAQRLDGETIAKMATEWDSDTILLFAQEKTTIEKLFERNLIKETIDSAKCSIQIIQPERQESKTKEREKFRAALE